MQVIPGCPLGACRKHNKAKENNSYHLFFHFMFLLVIIVAQLSGMESIHAGKRKILAFVYMSIILYSPGIIGGPKGGGEDRLRKDFSGGPFF